MYLYMYMPAYLFFPSLSVCVCVCVYDARDASAKFDPFHYFLGFFFVRSFRCFAYPSRVEQEQLSELWLPPLLLLLLLELLLKVKRQKAIFKNCYYKSAAKQKLG